MKLNGKWGYIDKTCKLVIPNIYDNETFTFPTAFRFVDDLAEIIFNGKKGYIDKNRTQYWD